MQLVIATHNVHKIREYRAILKKLSSWDILSLHDFPEYHLPQETGSSFEQNAILKATHAAHALYRNNLKNREFGKEAPQNFDAERATIAEGQGASEYQNSEAKPTKPKPDSSGCFGINRWVIADDSGLVVPALHGAPGIFSARYAGVAASDIENRRKLLHEMRDLQEQDRNAYYECWIALASPEGIKKCVKGMCEGVITTEEKGRHGFGYDPLFMKHEYSKTFGELDEDIKNRISHRRKALDKLIPLLEILSEKQQINA